METNDKKTAEEIFEEVYPNNKLDLFENQIDLIIQAINKYKNQFTPVSDGWISVEERLPEIDKLVILKNITDDWSVSGQMDSEKRFYNQFDSFPEDCSIVPTHWKPLTNNSVPSDKDIDFRLGMFFMELEKHDGVNIYEVQQIYAKHRELLITLFKTAK